MKPLPTCLTALAVAATAAGCGGSTSTGPTADRPVLVKATDDFRFVPDRLVVSGRHVAFRLEDTGSYPHNLSFPQLHRTSRTVTGTPGESATTLHVTFPHPGTYRFICTFHDQAGMTGVVTVR